MSNHHPGNEWYRRLVKSNRPLYRACPKHTKLLVAKAIVQAVEQQQGRFLEKSKKVGCWHQVSYKRAVDKTSQGLREKDRAGDDEPGVKTAETLFPTVTPQMDTTLLARQMSTREPFQQQQQQLYQHKVVVPAQVPTVRGKPATLLPASGMAPTWNKATATTTWDDDDETESEGVPEPLENTPRDTSMYRLLKHTSLLPGASLDVHHHHHHRPMEQQSLPQRNVIQQQQHVYFKMQLPNRDRRQQQLQTPQFSQQHQHPLYRHNNSPTNRASKQQQQQQPRTTTGSEKVEAPSFTRFQSQVSDWLNSFWPLQEGEAPAAAAAPSSIAPRPPTRPPPPPSTYQPSPSRKRKARYPPPTEPTEEETTSQTLLQYATSSNLFRGLTGLFTTTGGGGGPPSPSGGGKPSLLDDYEETPMEARMRQVE